MFRPLLILLFLCFASTLFAQETETDSVKYHSPRRATILSALLPGAGQVYNKKYWKLPIIYGGMGAAAYQLNEHVQELKIIRTALIAVQDDNPNTINTSIYPDSRLADRLDYRKRLRDQAYLVMAGVYAIQIIDAHVDAQLFHFDVSEDLSLDALPYVGGTAQPYVGLYLSLKL